MFIFSIWVILGDSVEVRWILCEERDGRFENESVEERYDNLSLQKKRKTSIMTQTLALHKLFKVYRNVYRA